LLTAISIERCLSVLCPIWCRSHRPKYLSGIISGMLWVLSLLLNTLGYVLCRLFTVIMLTVLFFLIFAVPLSVLILFDFLGYKFLYSPEIGFVLSCVNSSLNPVIYFLVGSYRDRRIKFTLRLAFQRAFED
ncbi:Proto-oncogene Mas, partial [Podiceps cristatus]